MKRVWYAYLGGNHFEASSYVKITTRHGCLCGTQICAIYLPDHGFRPEEPFSKNMQQYISDALVTQMIQPEDPYQAKKYVYLRH